MTETPQFDRRMLEALICPTTHMTLEYDSDRQELVSKKAKLAFPIIVCYFNNFCCTYVNQYAIVIKLTSCHFFEIGMQKIM